MVKTALDNFNAVMDVRKITHYLIWCDKSCGCLSFASGVYPERSRRAPNQKLELFIPPPASGYLGGTTHKKRATADIKNPL